LRSVSGLSGPALVATGRAVDEPQPLSFSQQRLWFINRLEPDSAAYNISFAVTLKGELDVRVLEQSVNEVVCRHESLRTRFVSIDGQPMQVVTPALNVSLPVSDLAESSEEERQSRREKLVIDEAQRPFDLAHEQLWRAHLLRLSADEHVLLFVMHHIISDGWSFSVLTSEIVTVYQAFAAGKPSPLADLKIQYADFAIWQKEYMQGDVLEAHLDYWRGQLAGAPPVLELPTDRPRPAVYTQPGARIPVPFSPALTTALEQVGQREGVTLFMTLLAGWQALLSRYTGQSDIVIGSPIANRHRAEIEPLIGFFVNTLVMRTDLSGRPTGRELLERVREVCLGAYAHQDVPFEILVEQLGVERAISHTPLFHKQRQVKLRRPALAPRSTYLQSFQLHRFRLPRVLQHQHHLK